MQKPSSPEPIRRPAHDTSVQYGSRERDALRAAQLYYLQDLKMEVIARELGTSRSTVSRLLTQARRTGMVSISISPSDCTS